MCTVVGGHHWWFLSLGKKATCLSDYSDLSLCLEFQVNRNADLTCTCLWSLWDFSYKNKPTELCSTRRMNSGSSSTVYTAYTAAACACWIHHFSPASSGVQDVCGGSDARPFSWICCTGVLNKSTVEKWEFCLFSGLYLFVSSVCMFFCRLQWYFDTWSLSQQTCFHFNNYFSRVLLPSVSAWVTEITDNRNLREKNSLC